MKRSYFGKLSSACKNSVGAGVHGDRREVAPRDDSVFVDDEQRSFANAVGFPIDPIHLGDGSLGLEIRQQRKMQVPVFGKSLVAPYAIHRNPQELGFVFLKLGRISLYRPI